MTASSFGRPPAGRSRGTLPRATPRAEEPSRRGNIAVCRAVGPDSRLSRSVQDPLRGGPYGERTATDGEQPRGAAPSAEEQPMTRTTDRSETAAAQAGAAPSTVEAIDGWQPPSWDEVVTQHSARVYRLAYRLTGNPHDAEDLTQEVFVRVFRSLSSYTPGTFEGWLHRIT